MVASKEHPVRISFLRIDGKSQILPEDNYNGHTINAQIKKYSKYTALRKDPSTEEIRKNNPNVWVELVDVEKHILAGGFRVDGTIEVDDKKIFLVDGCVTSTGDNQKATFQRGTKFEMDGKVFYFDGDWFELRNQ